MSIHTLSFPPSLRRSRVPQPRDYARRDRAIALFDEGRPLEAVHETLLHLLPELATPDLASAPIEFDQGSARVRIALVEGQVEVRAELAAITEDSNAVAALRYMLSRVAASGQLYQPRLRGQVLSLEYADPLALAHPQKLVEVLQRLPSEADQNDGWLGERFGLELSGRAQREALSEPDAAQAQLWWKQHWEDAAELLSELRRRRSVRLLNAIGSYLVDAVRAGLPLHGGLRAELQEYAERFGDSDLGPNERDAELAKCIRDMRAVDPARLLACLGHGRYALDPVTQGTSSLLGRILGDSQRRQAIGEMLAGGRALEAAMDLVADYHYLLAQFCWAAAIEAELQKGLADASGRGWSEMCETLLAHSSALCQSYASTAVADADEADAGEHAYQD
jgi:hypothetical protein